jgi:trehalose 6-phosphate synthase
MWSPPDTVPTVTGPIVLVSNRGPVSFDIGTDGELTGRKGGGGLVSGLSPLVAGSDATWYAAAMTEGERIAATRGTIETQQLRVRTLALDREIQRQAYDVVCNATLWFLHHGLYDLARRPRFDRNWRSAWDSYRSFNETFAETLAAEAPTGASVLVQDYHLALLGPMLTRRRPDLHPVHFSHTPFAPPHLMRVLPEEAAGELLEGMAGHHACGFHSERWAADFRHSCREVIGREPPTFVTALAPDPTDLRRVATSETCVRSLAELDARIGDRQVIVRVDRVELSKNVLRGFWAFDALLATRPDLRGRVEFLALGYPSREGLPEYLAYRGEVTTLAEMVNRRWGTDEWTPITLNLDDDFPRSVAALRRYDVLFVNPIRDGLNLVALEGPLVNERDGQLVVSREAGVWDQVSPVAHGVNPYDIDEQARALGRALDASAEARARHAARLREIASARTPRDWLDDLLAAVGDREPGS